MQGSCWGFKPQSFISEHLHKTFKRLQNKTMKCIALPIGFVKILFDVKAFIHSKTIRSTNLHNKHTTESTSHPCGTSDYNMFVMPHVDVSNINIACCKVSFVSDQLSLHWRLPEHKPCTSIHQGDLTL